MTTKRQVESNRRNAHHSTGPKTEQGKARSRGNAFQHGLAGSGVVCEEAVLDQLDERVAMWRPYFPARTDAEEWMLEQFALSTILLNRAQAEMLRAESTAAQRAETHWDQDRLHAMDQVARRLAKAPTETVRALESCVPGCGWLLIEWHRLLEEAEANRWSDEHDNRAHDLLGSPPEFRAGRPWQGDPKGFVRGEIARLEEAVERLDASEEQLRESALNRLSVQHAPAAVLAWRYERDWFRRYEGCRRRLERSLRDDVPNAAVVPTLASIDQNVAPPALERPARSAPAFQPSAMPASGTSEVLDLHAVPPVSSEPTSPVPAPARPPALPEGRDAPRLDATEPLLAGVTAASQTSRRKPERERPKRLFRR
ncbi:MAG: hypothetical protein U0794_11445 [Isosphaeraceae bacterium]